MPARIDARQRGCGLDCANGVDVEAAVVVRLGARDPARHHAGMLGARGAGTGIRRLAGRPGAALCARVHDEGRVTARRIERVRRRAGRGRRRSRRRRRDRRSGVVARAGRAEVPGADRVAVRAANVTSVASSPR